MVPAKVAELVVMADAVPVVTVGTEFTPAPVAAAFTELAPPPPTAILPLYYCTITGSNLTAANVTVGALTGFTYSTTAGGTYTSTLSLAQPGGAYSQQIFVQFTPTLVQ